MSETDWSALGLTLRLASVSTLVLMLLGTPLAWWLSRTRAVLKPAIQAIVALPIVLPPTVLGFYLLVLLGPQGPIGQVITALGGQQVTFTFTGLVIGSVVYSLPFVVQPLETAFTSLGRRPMEVAATLGAGYWDRLFTVAFPLARGGFLTAAILGFAHTLGEFGVVLMIGGNIPGETRVLSIAIYDHVEALDYAAAHRLALFLLFFSFALLCLVYGWNRRFTFWKS